MPSPEPSSGDVDFLSTQLQRIYIPERDESSSDSCAAMASPHSASDTLDHLCRVHETGNSITTVHCTVKGGQIETGSHNSSHTGEDDVPSGVIATTWSGDNTPSPSPKQYTREVSPIIMPSPVDALLPYTLSPDQPFSDQVELLPTPQLHKIHIPQGDAYSPGSCATTASPHSASDTLDHLSRVYETGNGISIHYTEKSYQIEMGFPYSLDTGEDNVFQGHFDPDFSMQHPYYAYKETLNPEYPSYDDLVQSVPLSYTPQSTSYPALTDLPATYDLPVEDAFDIYNPPSFFTSIEIQQHPIDLRHQEQKLRPVGSPAITKAARGRRERAAAFQCHLCRSAFTARHNLKNHMNAHMGLKLHLCQKCGRSFVTKHVLIRHRRTFCKQADGRETSLNVET